MTTIDILVISFFLIWILALVIFGILAINEQAKIRKINNVKETYKESSIVLSPIQLEFKLPEGEICYLTLNNHPAKIFKTKKNIVSIEDKWYVINALKYIKSKKIKADIYFTNKNIVIVSKGDNYKLKIGEGTVVKPGVKYVNHNLAHELIIKLDEKLYFLVQVKDKSIYQTYEAIIKK